MSLTGGVLRSSVNRNELTVTCIRGDYFMPIRRINLHLRSQNCSESGTCKTAAVLRHDQNLPVHHQQRFMSEDQSAGPPTTWDDDWVIVLADPTSPCVLRRPTDAIDACNERRRTPTPYSRPPRPVGKQCNDAMPPPQRTPALHAIDGSRDCSAAHTPRPGPVCDFTACKPKT